MPDPTQNQDNQNPPVLGGVSDNQGTGVPTNVPVQADLPPIPDFQNVSTPGTDVSPSDTGLTPPPSIPPSDFFPPAGSTSPKKKFGTNKIIATILGVLLLIGGIGAGVVLILQPQLLQQKAAVTDYNTDPNNCGSAGHACSTGSTCSSGQCVNTQTDPNNCGSAGNKCANGYNCTSGVCTGNPITTTCGRNNDMGAPVCCTSSNCSNTTCEQGRLECNDNGKFCTIQANSSSCGGQNSPPPGTQPPQSTPTPPGVTPTPGITAVCSGLKAYDSSWSVLSSTQLSALKVGNNINFCVAGTASSGLFDMARFTINGVTGAQTTTKRPGSNDFCQAYTIPTGVSTFDVTAQIHHVTLGWVGP